MSTPHLQRGLLLYQQGRHQDAVAELRMQLTQDSEDSFTHGLLALVLTELEQYNDATQHAHQSIHLAPDDAWGHYSLARVMLGRKRYDDARASILEAIRLNPSDADYFGTLANLELGKSRWREALMAADQGLAIDPEHNVCTNMRALALVQLGDRAAAASTMGQALARRPDDALTHANQGWAMLHAGQPYKALEHFRESLRLDPEMEWSRAGIVEALKARNSLYRWMLAWFLWMSRLTPGVRWGLIIGAYFGQRFIRQIAANSPDLAPFLWPLLYAYFGFVLLTWLAPSFFNLLLRLDRFGRYALSNDQLRGANVLAACLATTLACLIAWLSTGSGMLFYGTLMFALLALPASAIYVCDAGWPRIAMTAITLSLLAALLLVLTVGLMEKQLPPSLVSTTLPIVSLLPLAMLASQFAAMFLTQATVQK